MEDVVKLKLTERQLLELIDTFAGKYVILLYYMPIINIIEYVNIKKITLCSCIPNEVVCYTILHFV